MTASAAAVAPPAWHDDAERLGPALDRAAAVLVVGRDGDAAAWAALGAARAQAGRRRVAVADLVGDAPALAALVDPDDATGVSDSFFYGVSLNRIARPLDADGQLYVLPSGSEPVAVAEVLTSGRWRRLVAGFRDAGALLLLAARADAPGLDVLAGAVDGLVVVGDLGGLLPDAPPPLMVIPGPSAWRGRGSAARAAETRADVPTEVSAIRAPGPMHASPRVSAAEPPGEVPSDAAAWVAKQQVTAASAPAFSTPSSAMEAVETPTEPPLVAAPRRPTPGAVPAVRTSRRLRDHIPLALGVVALLGVAAIAIIGRRSDDAHPAPGTASAAPRAQAAPGEVASAPPAARAPAPVESAAAPPAPAVAATGPLAVANPADSARAAAYAVYLVGANTPEGATLDGVDQATLPVLSLTPVPDAGAPWWRLLAGAFATRARADGLLADLRRRGVLGASSGVVVRAPYALLVADRLPAAQAPARVEALGRRGVPTYPLSRGDGTVAVFAGAFERPGDAEYLATALRAAGVAPVLVYRTGGQ